MAIKAEVIQDAFNRDAYLPFELRINDFEIAMQDVYDFFADVNTLFKQKGLPRLDDTLRPAIMSGVLSDMLTSSLAKHCRSLIQNEYFNGHPDLIVNGVYRAAPEDKSNMAKYLFGGFAHCLYSVEKFQSNAERQLAVILEREKAKWFKPRKGQFQLFYRSGADQLEYQPDFVAETADRIYMLEPKASNQMQDDDVLAKRDVAVQWCELATDYSRTSGGKPWSYALIPHDVFSDNMTISGLVGRYGC